MASLDSRKTLLKHRSLIRNKPILNLIYRDWYSGIKKKLPKTGMVVEFGSGGGFIKEIIPRVLTSDVIKGPDIDKVINAEKLPFRSNSVSAFVMINTFHHIKNPLNALLEMQRCLQKGGRIIMIEPWNTIWSRFFYKNFHHELFDENAGWKIHGKSRLSDANGALPWIIFERDRVAFGNLLPNLEIVRISRHTPFSYLFSGGLSQPQLLPTIFYSMAKKIDELCRFLGLFGTVEISKV